MHIGPRGRWEIWQMPAQSGAAVQVTHAGGFGTFDAVDGGYLYYFKFSGEAWSAGPLFRVPAGGGPEVQVLPHVDGWESFDIGAKGVYFTPDMLALHDVCQQLTRQAMRVLVGPNQNCRVEDDFHLCGR